MNFPINRAPLYSFKNRQDIEQYKTVGCYFCMKVFETNKITHYTDDNKTVLCPICASDTVVPCIDEDELKKINNYFLKPK